MKLEEIMKMMGIIGESLIQNLDKNGELPLLIIGIVLLYAIGVYMKIMEDDGFAPNTKERRK